MEVRAFKHGDESSIVTLWNERVCGCYATCPLTEEVFCRDVLGKSYFEPEGLIVAFRRGRAVAFAHAGFRSSNWVDPDFRLGTVCMVAVTEDNMDAGKAAIAGAVGYLLRRGSRQVEAFTIDFPNTPFYNGLYGGEKAGMDEDHPGGPELLRRCHFRPSYGTMIMTAALEEELPPPLNEPPGMELRVGPWNSPLTGKDPSCCYGVPEELRRAELRGADGEVKVGMTFWHLDRYNQATGDRLAVVSHVGANEDVRGSGATVALQREVHRILSSEGASRGGLGTGASNGRAVSFYRKAGYRVLKNACTFYLDWRRYGDYRS